MIIVPAIDILDCKVVRIRQGQVSTAKVYSDNPLKIAERFSDLGVRMVHVVDLNAAIRNDDEKNRSLIKELLESFANAEMGIQLAGGIRSAEKAEKLLDNGARRIVLSSIAYNDFDAASSILFSGGKERVVLALDYDDERKVRTHGWARQENEKIEAALARFHSTGFSQFLLTSIKKDGMLEGPDIDTLKSLRKLFPKELAGEREVRLIASGGISSEVDLKRLSEACIDEAIVGKAIYEGSINISLLSLYNH